MLGLLSLSGFGPKKHHATGCGGAKDHAALVTAQDRAQAVIEFNIEDQFLDDIQVSLVCNVPIR